ncbi:hypothetical protein E3T43_07480 [Cryobacterium sp. Hh7]|uniref:hypothetical protein n=1 Tax=Cryobacterium sp. Hh7 TaxID=1259159 RepID=UPI00106A8D55|nr:hypothetical protein [Cryobacterium sp. Hh7]TFD58079.1 hypothetical protein E3T43_07480 [Cryobacterium sp. Hh7]
MSTDVTVYRNESLEARMGYARTMASAGDLIPKGLWSSPGGGVLPSPSPGKVLLVMETGAMLGIHPVAALSGVNIIEGKPSISPALMSALVRGAGHTLRVVTDGTVEGGDFSATATLTRSDDLEFTYKATWTPHRAMRAELCSYTKVGDVWKVSATGKGGGVKPWQAYTENMCKWRAVGEVCGEGAQDVIMGMHTPDELGQNVTNAGEMVSTPDTESEREPTEDWLALIEATDDKYDLAILSQRIQGFEAKDGTRVRDSEMTEAFRTAIMTHASTLTKDSRETPPPAAEPEPDENVVDAEVVPDEEPAAAAPEAAAATEPEESELAKYERESAEEYAAEMKLTGA